ncbi:CAP domain-containing protein [Bacillus sp. OV322]|uniref:CAP domain-containing protein n=1 Tax=Bacillus sp. OV322 TaxID=1882764 RepID=UPI00210DCFE9|nr:CAP domain-containing protein [Bacillus sp. OV322]
MILFFLIGIYLNIGNDSGKNPVLYGKNDVNPKEDSQTIKEKNKHEESGSLKQPREGIASIIGKPASRALKTYGKPARVDLSAFGYEWWIYNKERKHYFQLAVENGKVISAYGLGSRVNVMPFKIGQPIDELYSSLFFETSVNINEKGSSYRFELSEEDMNMRPLVKMGNVYAQLYLDKFTGTVSSIRFLNEDALLKISPYEMTYHGTLLKNKELTDEEWKKVELGNKKQIFDITNVMRDRFKLSELKWDEQIAEVAFLHSNDMSIGDYFSHTSPTKGDLTERLQKGDVTYRAAGENIAAHYIDAIEAMEGWLNSKGHREALLSGEFTDIGVGVYHNYYTQNFIAK